MLPAIKGVEILDVERPIFAEMAADGAFSPCLMVRKGPWKYIHCDDDPLQLFDILADRDELFNLCGLVEHRQVEAELLRLIHEHWTPAELKAQVEQSARQRLFIQRTRLAGDFSPWDFDAHRDSSQQYVRTGGSSSATHVKGLARYPYVKKPPDRPAHNSPSKPALEDEASH